MSYRVKETFASLQGEGAQAGRKAVFVRFSGCNLWSGRPEDRGKGVGVCSAWCDTDFLGGDRMEGFEIGRRAAELWGPSRSYRYCVLTGGEPALQVDGVLIDALRRHGFLTAIETNGTRPLPPGIGWITVSPKAGSELRITRGDELKVAWPQDGLDLDGLAGLAFGHFFLQPIDGPDGEANRKACLERCLEDPRWRMSIQSQKLLGIR